MEMFFVPMFFVCWINGQCLEGWKEKTKFKTEDECIQFTYEWMEKELYPALIIQGKGMPFRVKTACVKYPDGDPEYKKNFKGEKLNVLFELS